MKPFSRRIKVILAALFLLHGSVLSLADSDKPAAFAQPKGPLSPSDERGTFRLVPGFRVELVAAEPLVVDPVAMAFDESGRLFVAEMRGYPNAGVGHGKISDGKVKMLIDRDGDGYYETASTFAENLRFPTSVMPWQGGLIVAVAPDIVFFEDIDGDGRADRMRKLYSGFDLDNIQQLVNTLQWGLDNWVYACAGGKGGTIKSEERPEKPAVTLRGRGIRFHPERPGSLEPTSGGGQFGLTADESQHWFTATNSQHLRQIVLPDHYLRRNPFLSVNAVTIDIPDHGAASKVHRISSFESWRVERTTRRKDGADAKRFPTTELVPGGFITSACSPVVYTAAAFAEEFRGNVFVCDPANNLIHRDILVANGSAFSARRGDADCEFLASTDNWFRPVNLTIGPDGALYVADFYREVIETPLSLPDDIKQRLNLESRGRGRIWRIRPEKQLAVERPDLRHRTSLALVKQLDNANSWWRFNAQRLLIERQDRSVLSSLARLTKEAKTAAGKAHALWTLHGLQMLDDALILQALSDARPGIREQALRLAEKRLLESESLRAAAIKLANDPSGTVRFQLALSLGAAKPDDIGTTLSQLLRMESADSWLQLAVLSSANNCAGRLLQDLIDDRETLERQTTAQLQLLTRLAALVAARGHEREMEQLFAFLAKPGDKTAAWRQAVLQGVGQGLQSGQRSLAKLWTDSNLKPTAEQMLPLFENALKKALNTKRPITERVMATQLLGHGPFSKFAPALQQLISPQHPAEIQLAAVRALSLHEDARVGEILIDSWPGFSPTIRREVLEAVSARPERVSAFLSAIAQQRINAADVDGVRRKLWREHSDAKIRQKAATVLGEAVSASRKSVVDAFRSVLQLPPNVRVGKEVFKKNCSTCHRLENVGFEVGPDLLAALRNKTNEALLIDILDPSREVDPRFVNYVATTKTGRVFTGLIALESPSSLTLRRAERAEDTILRSQIAEIQSTAKSVMPEELEKQLSKQDVADLIAYLLSLVSQPQ